MNHTEKLTEPQQIILLLIGIFGELKNMGYVEEGQFNTTPKGIAMFDQLWASGLRANDEEIDGFLDFFAKGITVEEKEQLKTLVKLYQDGEFADET